MKIADQIDQGKLRCVRTGGTLARNGDTLVCGAERYMLAHGKVPVILKSQADIEATLNDNPAMEEEYRTPNLYQRLRDRFYRDYNSHDFIALAQKFINGRPAEELMLSIGGGPIRDGENVTNLNIGTFPNVDIVGDAHDLPYVDGSVDAIYCSAVLEHVREPITAVREMHRVLKPGAQVLSVIPFMQAYHGYPHHYQNFTISGHEYLYASNGFRVISSGAPLGPTVALTTLLARYFIEYLPKTARLNVIIGRGVQALGLVLRPIDRLLESHPERHVLASATYVLAEKL